MLRLESFSVFAWMDQVDIVTLIRAQIGSNADLETKNHFFVLLQEKDLKGTKLGKLTPALVVSVTRRPDNLISRLTVRAEGYKEEITRDLRDFCMTEDQYLKLSQPLHRCLVHDLSEGSRLDKIEAEVALDHYSRELLEGPKEGGN